MSLGEVFVGKKCSRVTGSKDPIEKNCKNINATSGSLNKIDGHMAKMMSPFYLGPFVESDIFEEMGSNLSALNLENYWQYHKIFKELGHLDDNDEITKEWYTFRNKGMKREKADRHPLGTKTKEVKYVDARGRNMYRYLTASSSMYLGTRMDYLTSRKMIYVPAYAYLVERTEAYKALKRKVDNGGKFMILDFDILPGSHLVTVEFLRERVNDTKLPFGHGYVLAGLLAGIHPRDYLSG